MKIAYRLFLLLLISAFLFSCSDKKVGIEGKLQNGQGQPISGVTVIFKQVQPSKGYEQFETKTLANGVFRIDGVMPSSEYIITPVSDNWKTKVTTKITTLSEGQTMVLSNPVTIRYQAMKDGTVVDTKTGLQWLILGITDLNSSNVLNSVKTIKEGGFTDWRLPTKAELSDIQETPAAPTAQTEAALVQKTCCAWVTEPNSENIEWKFYIDDGNDIWASSKVPPDDRVVIVRNYTPAAQSAQTPAASTAPASGTVAQSAQMPAKSATAAVVASPIPDQPVAAPAVTSIPAKQTSSAKVKTQQSGNAVTIQFGMNKSIISPEELSKLKAFYAKIKSKKGRIVIEGNSDADGDAADNFKISGERALNTKAMLHKLGLSKTVDVKIAGLSDTKPIADNTTEDGRKLNRRADITFIPGEYAVAAAPIAAPSVAETPAPTPSAKVVTIAPVKSEGGVLKASRKACIAKKAQAAKQPI